jgi:predicted NUDIX family phosphoesterase
MKKEQVLAINTSLMNAAYPLVINNVDGFSDFESIFAKEQLWLVPRHIAEFDFNLKQIIPYVVVKDHTGNILMYTRTAGGGDSRLHHKCSIGIGGHINAADVLIDNSDGTPCIALKTITNGMVREFTEELLKPDSINKDLVEQLKFQVIAVINSNITPVDKVHIGILVLVELDEADINLMIELENNEDGMKDITFLCPQYIKDNYYESLESWSKIAFDFVTTTPSYSRIK